MARFVIAILASAALHNSVAAQEHAHGTPAEKIGSVHFATSCNDAAQPKFDRAVAFLHSFEFGESIKGFESVLAADSTCAVAYWGIALSRWSNPMATGNRTPAQLTTGRNAVDSALLISPHATDRERQYIAAVRELYNNFENTPQATRVAAYERAMNDIVLQHPADTEAKIFHAIALVASASPTDKTYANQKKAGATLQRLWEKQPNHPGLAHYLIHAYDYPALASRGDAAARGYSLIAPSTPHALHMPSHIFTRTGLWQKSIDANRKSMSAAMSAAAIAEVLHAADYAEYAYLQLGRDSLAKSILQQLPAIEAKFDPNAITGAAPGSAGIFALAAIPARYALEREAWSEAAALQPKRSPFEWVDAMTYFARALGAAHTKDLPLARSSVDSLAAIRNRVAASEQYWGGQVGIQHLAAKAWVELASGNADSALAYMREAARREDATEKSAITPGPLAPARELLGDMLLQLKKPREALAEYQKTLLKEPNRRRALQGAARARKLL